MILVTGVSGQVGSSTLCLLNQAGLPVIGLSSTNRHMQNQGYIQLRAQPQLTDLNHLELGDVSTIVHCAAAIPYGDIDSSKAAELNRIMDDCVLEFAKERGASCIFLSSTSVYGMIHEEVDELAQTKPLTPYAKEKLRSEKSFLDSVVATTVVRISSPYGLTKKYSNVLWTFVDSAAKGDDLNCFGSGARSQDFTFSSDIANFVLLAQNRQENGVFNVTSGQDISMYALAELVVREFASDSKIVIGGAVDPDEEYRARFSIARAKRVFGWSPNVPLREGIRRIKENYFANNGVEYEP